MKAVQIKARGGPKRSLLRVLWELWRTPKFKPVDLMTSNRGVIGLHLGRMTDQKELLARAHEYIQSRQNVGKVVLTTGR